VRIATNARSPAWIASDFESQRPGSTFIKEVAAPEPAPKH
jgi:hypothetical protein